MLRKFVLLVPVVALAGALSGAPAQAQTKVVIKRGGHHHHMMHRGGTNKVIIKRGHRHHGPSKKVIIHRG